VSCEKNEYPNKQVTLEALELTLQFVSTVSMEKHHSITYTLQMAAEISFVPLVPTEETTHQNFHKAFLL